MDGQKRNPVSGGAPRKRGRVGRFPDRICFAAPPRTRERVEAAATFAHQSPAEWLRGVLRLALEASRKRQARAAGGAK